MSHSKYSLINPVWSGNLRIQDPGQEVFGSLAPPNFRGYLRSGGTSALDLTFPIWCCCGFFTEPHVRPFQHSSVADVTRSHLISPCLFICELRAACAFQIGLLPSNSPGGEGWQDGQTEPEPGCMTDRLNPRKGAREAEVGGDRWLGVAHKNLSSDSVEVQTQSPCGT